MPVTFNNIPGNWRTPLYSLELPMPTIREWMLEYNRLAQIATARGLGVREYRNLRVSNDEARARVESLAARLGTPLLIGFNAGQVPDPATVQAPAITPRIRTLRPRRRRHSWTSFGAAPVATPALVLSYPVELTFADMTYGVEIECCVPAHLTNIQIAQRLTEAGLPTQAEHYNHGLRSHWKIVSDGSVNAASFPRHRGQFELVSPPMRGSDVERQVEIATRVLAQIDAKVNRSCGLHVHVGVAPSIDNAPFFQRLVGLVYTHTSHFNSIVAPSRRGNMYCKPINPSVKGRVDVMTTVQQIISGWDRFSILNLAAYSRHHTVEFRQHQGTIECDKIMNWVRLVASVVIAAAKGTTAAPTENLEGFLAQIEAGATETAFLVARRDRFLTSQSNR